METDLEPITPEEVNLIKQLRKNMSDINLKGDFDTDIFYLKWIRAREHYLQKAEDMLRKSISWRKEFDIDNVVEWEVPVATIPVDYPLKVCGYNKVGSPVVIIPFSYWDVTRGVQAGHGNDMIRYIDQCLETVENEIRRKSTKEHPVTQLDLIFDMNNLSFWQLASKKTIETILEVVRRYEANHPEILHKAYVINASRMFYMLFNIVKPFLSPRTLAKVNIFPTQFSQWSAALLKDIESHQLPSYFGGTGSLSAMKMYEEDENSRSMYKLLRKNVDSEKNWTTININPEEKVLLTFDIEIANSKLIWEFKTDHFDIEFSLYKEGMEDDPEISKARYPSWILKYDGEVTCKTPGQYIAEFNHQYSQFRRARTLHYHFKMVEPNSN